MDTGATCNVLKSEEFLEIGINPNDLNRHLNSVTASKRGELNILAEVFLNIEIAGKKRRQQLIVSRELKIQC